MKYPSINIDKSFNITASNMIDFNARIVSGVSIGNVVINENISLYINEMHSRFSVKIKNTPYLTGMSESHIQSIIPYPS